MWIRKHTDRGRGKEGGEGGGKENGSLAHFLAHGPAQSQEIYLGRFSKFSVSYNRMATRKCSEAEYPLRDGDSTTSSPSSRKFRQ